MLRFMGSQRAGHYWATELNSIRNNHAETLWIEGRVHLWMRSGNLNIVASLILGWGNNRHVSWTLLLTLLSLRWWYLFLNWKRIKKMKDRVKVNTSFNLCPRHLTFYVSLTVNNNDNKLVLTILFIFDMCGVAIGIIKMVVSWVLSMKCEIYS